jgi:hypothetical protein
MTKRNVGLNESRKWNKKRSNEFRKNGLQDERRGKMNCHTTAYYKLTLAQIL